MLVKVHEDPILAPLHTSLFYRTIAPRAADFSRFFSHGFVICTTNNSATFAPFVCNSPLLGQTCGIYGHQSARKLSTRNFVVLGV